MKLNKNFTFAIAIDGGAASGKSTGSKIIAKFFKRIVNCMLSSRMWWEWKLKVTDSTNKANKEATILVL